ncbi:MAG: Mg/Co/Ni transporter MgtE / CBS domain [uncultured Thiotrichaceae bacterium]|uniref:Magnesium transporter MgtE n=1 Tax=uncultured Thiotrichaceae bacterium TaxID=298394 RepID=A0A6S6SX38_9GAMM|nr:MAG: Mg/Co/Ni transporter MgtE / CBS domain [uncultured Thiotrichaceae bacterium]
MSNLEHQSSEQRLDALYEAIQTGSLSRVKRMLNAMHPAEIADLIEASPRGRRELIWEMTEPDNEGEVLVELSEDVRNNLIEEMDTGEIISAIKDLDYDDMADFLQSLPDALITQTLAGMDRQNRIRLEAVLAYDEDTAGGMMDTETVTVRADVSLDVVLRYLRRQEALPSHTDNIIVVNRYDRYLGILPLSTMLTNQPEALVVDVMETKQQPIKADIASQQVARLFEDRNLISAPVVDENHKLLGRITIDDVVDIIREEAEHSVMSMAGLDDDEDLFAPVVISARRRAVWLGTNLMTALIAAWVISQFEATLESTVALAILMGVIPSMGGVAGTQTLTLVIRGFALGQLGKSNMQSLLTKEILVSLMNGIIWALVIFAIATFAFGNFGIGLVIGLAMIINLLAASSSGVFLPIIMRRFNIDPALAGGVVLTTITDIVGFAAVLGLAALLL